jgi:drug/metabolite transporter (DMT)-like permease
VSADDHDPPLLTAGLIATGVLAVSFSGPIAASCLAPALAIAFWRNALGAAAGAPYTLLRRRPELASLVHRDRRVLATAVLAGLFLALHFGLWIPSLRLTTVTASTALVTTTPLFTVAITRLRGISVPRGVLVGVLLALVGVVVITGVDATGSARALRGDLMALAGGAAAAGYVAAGESVRRTVGTASYTLVAYTTCALTLLPVCLLTGTALSGFSARSWVEIVVLTLTAQLLGHTLLNRALRSAGATTVSLAVLLEVPGASLVAWVWLGQVPPLAVLPGALLVLAGLAVVVRTQASGRSRRVVAEVGNVTTAKA